jgi:hypothetical protein
MKKYALITTCYCENCSIPSTEELTRKFKYDGDVSDLFVNFSNEFSPFNGINIPNVGVTKRRDLVYGKIFLLKDFIETNILGKYEYLCHIDYSDTKFAGSYLEMMQKFESTNQDIIISTEKQCWPYIDTVSSWLSSPITENEFFYINSGAIIAKVDYFYNMLLTLINICLESNIDFWDDQGVWQYYHLAIKPLNSDKTCEYFFSTALLDETYYSIENGKVVTKYGTIPYLIHDNSSFSLNLTSKI